MTAPVPIKPAPRPERTTQKRPMPKLDQRRFQRVKVDVLGRLMLENRLEYPCQVITMSPGDVFVTCAAVPPIGTRVIAYFDQIGRVEGDVTRVEDGGFAFAFVASARKRDKLANQLTWLANRHELNLAEDRRHGRDAPKNPFSEITLPNGDKHRVRILDMSLSGAAIQLNLKLEMGTPLMLGKIRCRVVRIIDEGVAVEFATIQEDESGLR